MAIGKQTKPIKRLMLQLMLLERPWLKIFRGLGRSHFHGSPTGYGVDSVEMELGLVSLTDGDPSYAPCLAYTAVHTHTVRGGGSLFPRGAEAVLCSAADPA